MLSQKICPQCRTINAINAAQCYGCGHWFQTQFTPPIHQTQAVPPLRNTGRNPVLMWVGGCCGFPFAALLLLLLVGSLIPHKHDGICALVLSQFVVMERIQAPDAAKFASAANSTIIQDGRGGFVVRSYMDYRNSFGMPARLHFICHLKPNGEEDYLDDSGRKGWTVISFEITR